MKHHFVYLYTVWCVSHPPINTSNTRVHSSHRFQGSSAVIRFENSTGVKRIQSGEPFVGQSLDKLWLLLVMRPPELALIRPLTGPDTYHELLVRH